MKERNHISLPSVLGAESEEEEEGPGASAPPPAGAGASSTEHDELLSDLLAFVAFGAAVDGQAGTQEVLEHFTPRLTAAQTPVFRQLLRSLCVFSREGGAQGTWRLKPQYR